MKLKTKLTILFFILLQSSIIVKGQEIQKTLVKPVFENGEAQIVPEFNNPDSWIQHDLWVETEFDSDGDGKPDRMHVDVTRPVQTETEG